jgi:predicted nucleotidyltransferase
MAKKPLKRSDQVEVIYSEKRWKLLEELRRKAIETMEVLEKTNLFCIVHGSIARGDVSEKSDIDVFVPNAASSFLVESALNLAKLTVTRRILVQATPSYAAKGYVELAPELVVSFPLMKLRPVEREFYKFGGEALLQMLKNSQRVIGVDKRLMLIEPTVHGHTETTIVGQEEIAAKILGVSVKTVLDRVRALIRRDEVGRTGVFIEQELSPNETFEMTLKQLADKKPEVRRRLKLSGR